MKRTSQILLIALLALFATAAKGVSQENQEEKKITKKVKIIAVDESGNKTISDTVITGSDDLKVFSVYENASWVDKTDGTSKVIKSKDGKVMIISSEGDSTFTITTGSHLKEGKSHASVFTIVETDDEGENELEEIHVLVEGHQGKDGKSMVIVRSGDEGDYEYVMHDKGAFLVKSSDPGKDLKDGEVKITIRSKGEVEEVVVDGDAVITIKDGKTTIEGKKVEKEITKTEKKVIKKDVESKEDTESKKATKKG